MLPPQRRIVAWASPLAGRPGGRDLDRIATVPVLVKEGVDQLSVLLVSVGEPGGYAAAATAEKRRAVVLPARAEDGHRGQWPGRPIRTMAGMRNFESGLGHVGLLRKEGTADRAGCPAVIP